MVNVTDTLTALAAYGVLIIANSEALNKFNKVLVEKVGNEKDLNEKISSLTSLMFLALLEGVAINFLATIILKIILNSELLNLSTPKNIGIGLTMALVLYFVFIVSVLIFDQLTLIRKIVKEISPFIGKWRVSIFDKLITFYFIVPLLILLSEYSNIGVLQRITLANWFYLYFVLASALFVLISPRKKRKQKESRIRFFLELLGKKNNY